MNAHRIAIGAGFLGLLFLLGPASAQVPPGQLSQCGAVVNGHIAAWGPRIGCLKDGGGAPLTGTLTNTHIFVGNASNVATDVAVSGDATLANTGALTVTKLNGVSPGTLYPLGAGTGLSISGSNLILTAPVTVALGGTNATSASGTALDNISGFASTGFLTRTGAGAYAFQSATNGITLGNIAQSGANTMLGNWSGSTANVSANAMPSCPDSSGNHLNYVSGTGITCGTGSGGVTSIAGTANQINQSGSPGATTLSLSSTLVAPGTVEVTGTTQFDSAVTVLSTSFGLSGNISAPTWTTNGVRYKNVAGTLTDTTAATGTTATAYTDVWGGNTIAASNASVVFTNYYGAYFKVPVAGSNVTLTNAWALGADSLQIGTSGTFKVSSAGILTTTSPVFTTPVLGTPSSGNGSNLTALNGTNISSGNIAVARIATALGAGGNAIVGTTLQSTVSPVLVQDTDLPYIRFDRPAATPKAYFGVSNGSSLVSLASAGDIIFRAEQAFWTAVGGTTIGLRIDSSGFVYFPSLGSSSVGTTGTICWTAGTPATATAGLLNVDTTTTCLLSALKYKMNIRPLDGGISTVMRMRPISYDLKPQYNPTHLGRQVGFIADEVFKIDPRLVALDEHGKPHGMRYQQYTAELTLGIQQQQAEIQRQTKEIASLRAANDNFEQRLAKLEHRK